MKCPVCKNEIARVDGRCPHCGCNLDDPQIIDRIIREQEKEEKKTKPQHSSGGKSSKKKLFVGLYAGVAVVVVAACIFAVLSTQPKGDQKVVASQTQTPKPSTPKPTSTSKFSFEPIVHPSSEVVTSREYQGDKYLNFGNSIWWWAQRQFSTSSDRLEVTFLVSNTYEEAVESFSIKYRLLDGNYREIYHSSSEWAVCHVPPDSPSASPREVTCSIPYSKRNNAYYLYVEINKVRFADGVTMDTDRFNMTEWNEYVIGT